MTLGSEKLSQVANMALVLFLVVSVFLIFLGSGTTQYNVEANETDLEALQDMGMEVADEGQEVGNETTSVDQDPAAVADVEGSIFGQTLTGIVGFMTNILSILTNMVTTIIAMLPLGTLTNPLVIAASAAIMFTITFRIIVPMVLRR